MEDITDHLASTSISSFHSLNYEVRNAFHFVVTIVLDDGHKWVMANYLVPTIHLNRFNAVMFDDGLRLNLQSIVPQEFADLATQITTGELDLSNVNHQAFALAHRKLSTIIVISYDNLDNIVQPEGWSN